MKIGTMETKKMMRRNAVVSHSIYSNDESEKNKSLEQPQDHVNNHKNNNGRRRKRYPRRGGVVLPVSSISISTTDMKDDFETCLNSTSKTEQKISDTHIVIDQKLGFHIDHEGNDIFFAILDTYYTNMYAEVVSEIHRGIILNTAIDDIYSRGFKFIWRSSSGALKVLKDDVIILKQIKSLLKRRVQ